jgi:proteic killer suppression protein
MILSFGDRLTEDLFHGTKSKKVKRLDKVLVRGVVRKLDMLNAAHALNDLRSPPGNRLEPLVGDLVEFHSIRVNQQWRLVFRWQSNGCSDVRFVDYHH